MADTVDERQAQIEALVALGLGAGQAYRAVTEDRVALVLVERLLAADARCTIEEAARSSGVPLEYLRARDHALGIPETQGFTEQETGELEPLVDLLQLVEPKALLRALQSDTQALVRIAMGNLQLIQAEIADPIRSEGGDSIAVALALAEAAHSLIPVSGTLIGSSYRRVLTHLLSTELVAASSRTDAGHVDLAVGFVDVVGYTSLSARIDPDGLDEVLEAFETRCFTTLARHERVQLVKFLGDAAMFVSVDAACLADALLDLVAPADADSPLAGAPMRGGMSAGKVLPRGGDYFGPPVNLAARLTDRARTGTLVADESLAEELAAFRTRRLPPLHLRGVGLRRPLRVRPANEG